MSAPPASLMPAGGRRPAALAVTLALHALLAALFLARHPDRPGEGAAQWITMVPLAPVRMDRAPAPRQPRAPDAAAPRAPAAVQPRPHTAAPAARPEAAAPPGTAGEPPVASAAPEQPSAFELARAAAGTADKELRKQFPERKLLRTLPRTDQQKLADGIAAAVAPPRFYEPARITKVQDQGGWGRRIEKVQTAFGTYCITYEGNHGGDGRDVFKDALQPKLRTCPREE